MDLEKIKSWIARGAQPSDTVKSLVRQVESGKLDALPDLPKLEPMPLPAMEGEAVVAGADEGAIEPGEVDASTAAEELSEAQTADIPVPETDTADEDGESGEKEPEKAAE